MSTDRTTGALYALAYLLVPIAASAQAKSIPQGADDLVGVTITTVVHAKTPTSTASVAYANIGESLIVRGRGFLGNIGVTLREAVNEPGKLRLSTGNATLFTVAPIGQTSTSFTFVAPTVPLQATGENYYFVIVTRGQKADTSKRPIILGVTERKITRVEHTVVRTKSGVTPGRVKIHGIGFVTTSNRPLDPVTGGYFGTGPIGSQTNQQISTIVNLSENFVELVLPASCDQEGTLVLVAASTTKGGPDRLITSDTPITVTCVEDDPKGVIIGSEAAANNVVWVKPYDFVRIKGTGLKYVTGVVDRNNVRCGFKLTSEPPFGEILQVTISPCAGQLLLLTSLINPVVSVPVSGGAYLLAMPTIDYMNPLWAEPGQSVYLRGTNFTFGQPPRVTVGGVAAQVVSATATTVEIRLGTGTTAGPIELTSEGGKVMSTGPLPQIDGHKFPAFFVVAGPSVVQSVTAPRRTIAAGDLLVVKGQNLARLEGICVRNNNLYQGQPPDIALRRARPLLPYGDERNNNEMTVVVGQPVYYADGTAVQLYAPTVPPGPQPPTQWQFACVPNSESVAWPPGSTPPPVIAATNPPVTLSLTTSGGTALGNVPTCTDGTRSIVVTGSAPTFSVALTTPGSYTVTCSFRVSGPTVPSTDGSGAAGSSGGPPACAGGCFNATGTNDGASFTLGGPAFVNVDDGSRFQFVLGKVENLASYVSFARDPGGPPRPGTYAIADQCSEQAKPPGSTAFGAEFVTRAYEADALSFLSAGGSLVIERSGEGRLVGRFSFDACRHDTDGKRHDVRVRGTFDAVR